MSQQVRDAVARLEGWATYNASNGLTVWEFGSIEDGTYTTATDHPIPDDLTACVKAWDEHAGANWFWEKGNGTWRAYNVNGDGPIGIDETASELRDRWELLGLVLKARGVV